MPAMLSCIKAFLWVLETELPSVPLSEASAKELQAAAIQQRLRHQRGNSDFSLSRALEITTALFGNVFPTIDDAPGFPVPLPAEGQWESTWMDAARDAHALEALCQENFGMCLADMRLQMIDISARIRKLTGQRFFIDEETARECYASWRQRCFLLFQRSWPVFIDVDWAIDVVSSGEAGDNIIQNYEFMAALDSLRATKGSHYAQAISVRLREFLCISSDSKLDPDWYVDERDGVVSRRVAIWEVVIGLDGLDDEADE